MMKLLKLFHQKWGLLYLPKAAQAATGLGHFAQAIEILQSFEWKKLKEKLFLEESLLVLWG